MPKYGLISETDSKTIEEIILLLLKQFPNTNPIEVCEIGVYAGETGNGIREFIEQHNRKVLLTGIDNNNDNEPLRFRYDELIIGNSTEVYNKVEDYSQHLIFVDGDHSLIGVIGDFFAYSDKVKKGGYFVFHDTGRHIQPFKDFQHGDPENPDAYISVRKALNKIGLRVDSIKDFSTNEKKKIYEETGMWFTKSNGGCTVLDGWQLIFDEADPSNHAGGICVFQKLY